LLLIDRLTICCASSPHSNTYCNASRNLYNN
jgi:hypothetical protein